MSIVLIVLSLEYHLPASKRRRQSFLHYRQLRILDTQYQALHQGSLTLTKGELA